MTATRDFDDIARAWLDVMPNEAPDRAVDAVLEAVSATPQARPRRIGPWRFSPMARLGLVGGLAAVVVIAGALALAPRSNPEVANPNGSSSPSASLSASPDAGQTGTALDDALRSTWIAFANENQTLSTGAGPVKLSIGPIGTSVDAQNFGPGHGYASSAVQLSPTRIAVDLDRDGGGCVKADRGVYDVALNDAKSFMTLTKVSDGCANRALVFGRVWARSLDDPTNFGAGVSTALDPDFSITMPDDTYQTRHLDDFVEIAGANVSLMVHKNPQPFADPCSTAEERVPYQPGAAAFVDFFKGNDAYVVTDVSTLTVNGRAAMHATITGKLNYARCPGQPLYEYTPKSCGCHFIVDPGGADSMYLVEVGSDTFLFILSPIGTNTERQVIDSIRMPFALPSD